MLCINFLICLIHFNLIFYGPHGRPKDETDLILEYGEMEKADKRD